MIRFSWTSLLAWIVLLPAQASCWEVIKDRRWPKKLLVQTIIVPPSSFEPASLASLFSEILLNEGGTYSVMKIEVFTDRKAESANCKCVTDVAYKGWLSWLEDYRRQVPPSAQFISINGNAAMRVRDASGNVRTTVIAGEDPNKLTIRGMRFQLADFIAGSVYVRALDTEELQISFYYWSSDSYDKSTVNEVLTERVKTTGVQNTSVVVEPWPWFILSDEFPILYPYDSLGEPPSEDAYYSALRVTCSNVYGPPSTCRSYGGTEGRN
jgi:hypothetical protein